MPKYKIENVVASASIGENLDLNVIKNSLEDSEYEPDRFPGLIYRIKKPKAAMLIFGSGKVVCTGAKSADEVKIVIQSVIALLKKAGIKVDSHPDITVQNIVASSDLKTELNLNGIAVTLGLDHVEYEPEQFPGLIYRMNEPHVVLLLFASGKVICTGAKSPPDVDQAIKNLVEVLRIH